METDNKKISMSNSNLLRDIEGAFVLLYPYLKIEFFKIEEGPHTIRSVKIDPKVSLRQLANIEEHSKINISNNRTVAEVTHDFEHLFGTIVKVSRRSGNVWIAISITEGWTLESQNAAGEFISNEMASV